MRPGNPYAVSKAASEMLAAAVRDGLRAASGARCARSTTPGPGQSDEYVLATLARQVAEAEARGDPRRCCAPATCRRAATSPTSATWCAATRWPPRREPGAYNVCSGRATRVVELIEHARATAATVPVRHEVDPRACVPPTPASCAAPTSAWPRPPDGGPRSRSSRPCATRWTGGAAPGRPRVSCPACGGPLAPWISVPAGEPADPRRFELAALPGLRQRRDRGRPARARGLRAGRLPPGRAARGAAAARACSARRRPSPSACSSAPGCPPGATGARRRRGRRAAGGRAGAARPRRLRDRALGAQPRAGAAAPGSTCAPSRCTSTRRAASTRWCCGTCSSTSTTRAARWSASRAG